MGLVQIGPPAKDGDLGIMTLSLEKAVNWARKGFLMAHDLWLGLLRD